jgi:prepilin-type processing-associated H-X9-DG protein
MQPVMQISDLTQAWWTDELHYRNGEILFGDGHVEFTNTKRLREALDPEMQAKEPEKRSVRNASGSESGAGPWTRHQKMISETKTNRIAIP